LPHPCLKWQAFIGEAAWAGGVPAGEVLEQEGGNLVEGRWLGETNGGGGNNKSGKSGGRKI